MVPRKGAEPPKKPQKKPSGKSLNYWMDFYPVNGGDPYYRNVNSPLELVLLIANDERKSLKTRFEAAVAALPYCHAKVSPKPYVPSPDEQRALEDKNRLVIELVEYREISDDDLA